MIALDYSSDLLALEDFILKSNGIVQASLVEGNTKNRKYHRLVRHIINLAAT